MYELNELELATVVGGTHAPKLIFKNDIFQFNTAVGFITTGHSKVELHDNSQINTVIDQQSETSQFN